MDGRRRRVGAEGCVAKPSDIDELAAAVRETTCGHARWYGGNGRPDERGVQTRALLT